MAWVSSSNLASVWYKKDRQILTVEFHGGRAYRYLGVPLSVAIALDAAPSKGKFFHKNIREKYAYLRIR